MYAHISHKPVSRRIRKANAQSSVTESHYTCGLLTLLTTGEVKKRVSNLQPNQTWQHIYEEWADWSVGTRSRLHTFPTPLHKHTANGQCNWTQSFYHQNCVLYGTFGIHHLAYFNIFVPEDFLPDFLKILK